MNKYWSILLLISSICLSWSATAQDSETTEKGSVTLVTNPAYFVLGGYHIKPSYHFPKKWSLGLTIQGGFELPEFARDQFFDFSGDDITVDWTYAIGAELKYRFSKASFDKGLYTAFNLGYEGWDVKNASQEESFDNWFASIDLGYNWYPFKKERFHVGVNYTLIFILNNTEDRTLGETTYNIDSIVPPSLIPSILVGWRFK